MFTMNWRRWTRLDLKDQYFGCEIEMTGITREQAALHPQKNLITRALGVSANIVPEYNRCEVVPGDLLLLCTDGLTNMVPDAELALLLQESAFFDAPGVLVDRALKGGGQDNITVLLLGVETTEETNG